jgi:hypothetical protein
MLAWNLKRDFGMTPAAVSLVSLLLALHLHAAVTAPAQRHPGRLKIEGTRFVDADGSTFQWRGITAFRLVDYIADGQEPQAEKFLEWASAQGLTVVRVLTMMGGQFELSPPDGRRALPRLLALAAAQGLHVEVVALAGTADSPVDLKQHLGEIARIVAAHPNAILEIANEPVHPSQAPDVQKPEVLASLAAAVPDGVPVSLGSIERGDGFGAGSYITWHSPRESGNEGWGHVLALAGGAELLARWRKPVISDEPIGAGNENQPGRRDNMPARFRAAALLTRLVGLGATFHYEGGIQARIPAGRELDCFNAWKEAWKLLPPDVEQTGKFASGVGTVVKAFDASKIAGVYQRADAARGWVLVVGAEDSPVTLADGWRFVRSQRLDGVRLITARRAKG